MPSSDQLYKYLHRGNLACRRKDFDEARLLYIDAIKLFTDKESKKNIETNNTSSSNNVNRINKTIAVLYSNLSGVYAHLKLFSESLKYAELSIQFWPQFAKAYGRKGCALSALGQKFDSIKAYEGGLELHPSHQGLLSGLESARAMIVENREEANNTGNVKKRHLPSSTDNNSNIKRAKVEKLDDDKNNIDSVNVVEDFVSEVLESEFTKNESKITVDHSNIGTAKEELERLLQKNYAWINLNPFEILKLPITASSEDVKQRYRILSSLIHPDKCKDERARLAFEEVHRGYDQLRNDKTKQNVIKLIKMIKNRVKKEWQKNKNLNEKNKNYNTLEEAIKFETLKSFAENEKERREAIDNRQSNRVRTGNLKLKAKEEKKMQKKRDQEWKKNIEKRVESWNEFIKKQK